MLDPRDLYVTEILEARLRRVSWTSPKHSISSSLPPSLLLWYKVTHTHCAALLWTLEWHHLGAVVSHDRSVQFSRYCSFQSWCNETGKQVHRRHAGILSCHWTSLEEEPILFGLWPPIVLIADKNVSNGEDDWRKFFCQELPCGLPFLVRSGWALLLFLVVSRHFVHHLLIPLSIVASSLPISRWCSSCQVRLIIIMELHLISMLFMFTPLGFSFLFAILHVRHVRQSSPRIRDDKKIMQWKQSWIIRLTQGILQEVCSARSHSVPWLLQGLRLTFVAVQWTVLSAFLFFLSSRSSSSEDGSLALSTGNGAKYFRYTSMRCFPKGRNG